MAQGEGGGAGAGRGEGGDEKNYKRNVKKLLNNNYMSVNESLKQSLEDLEKASPLEIPQILEKMELYDQETAEELLDKVNSDFQKEGIIDNVVTPTIASLLDGILRHPKFKGVVQKTGLSATTVIQECKNFNYDGSIVSMMPDAFVEYHNRTESEKQWGQKNRSEYIRKQFEDHDSMNKYKNQKIEENGNRKNIEDQYRQTKDITPKKDNPDNRRDDPKNQYNAETDHIIPLKHIFNNLQNNSGLSDSDIKEIANKNSNFAITARFINNPKRDMLNSEFIKAQDKAKAAGKPYIELSPEVRNNMLKMEKEALSSMENDINHTVISNLLGKGKAGRKELKEAIEKKEAELGRKLTKKEYTRVYRVLAKEKAYHIHKGNLENAGKQTFGYAIGAALLFIVKPLYYELKDGILYGFKEGVCANTYKEAFNIRFNRIKEYVWKQISSLKKLLGSAMEMLKNFLSALIEGLLGMFVGIFKKIFKVLKEGVKVFVQAWPILFGEHSKEMSANQKGDAILKLLGGSVVALCGIGIDMLLEKASFIPEDFRGVVSTMLTGLASILLFYALDKADLFNVKEEERKKRVREIFADRIKDIKEATKEMNEKTMEIIKQQKIKFNKLLEDFDNAALQNDYNQLNEIVIKQAVLLGINLPMHNGRNMKWEM